MNDSYCAASSDSSQLHENTADENPIQVAGRLFGALEYLAYNGTSTLAELTQALGLNKSTTHRVLASLQYMNYVRQDPGTGHYEATFKLAKLAEQLLEQVDVAQMSRPYLKELSAKVKETVHFVERDKDKVVYVDKVDCADHSMHMRSYIGSKIPFYRTGVGKAMMANLTDPEIMALWNSCSIEKRTAYTPLRILGIFWKKLRMSAERDMLWTMKKTRRESDALLLRLPWTGVPDTRFRFLCQSAEWTMRGSASCRGLYWKRRRLLMRS